MKYIKVNCCYECKFCLYVSGRDASDIFLCTHPDTLFEEIPDELEIAPFCKHEGLADD